MDKHEKVLEQILSGKADYNVSFNDLVAMLQAKGFKSRQRGSHIIFTKQGVEERINLQTAGSHAKGYQVRQIRNIFIQHPELL